MSFDIQTIRKDFPILQQQVYGKPYSYFDSAATALRPVQVLNAVSKIYNEFNGNPHRGAHYMSNQTTLAYEAVRDQVQHFINAPSREEIIFTKGSTESINLVAYSFGEAFVSEGDEIIISEMEHHANIVPWQLLAQRKKAVVKVLPVSDSGELMLEKLDELISDRTKLMAFTLVSNVLGTINPLKSIIETAHLRNIPVLVDAAQGVQHGCVDVQDLDCDFMVFSGHKLYGPTGVGCLYGKRKWLDAMPPFLGGGEMIEKVSFEGTSFNALPYKFEAGTPNFTEVIGLGAAIDYIQEIGLTNISEYEHELLEYASSQLGSIKGMRIIGEAANKASVISFLVGNIHPYDMGMFLDKMGFALRTGHHCAQPLMDRFGIPGTVRLSLAFYNTKEEIDQVVKAIEKTAEMLT
ncbi:aminotransferase class V-fold PLP-dependent enzyme [Roseimarinus sediminis]|uniref:aminotransferase class V-fold PLP-dependent enzyme n=1 Tax=Roseimarinus sediminis TaxID=1610899 RepID=UPI003D23A7B6